MKGEGSPAALPRRYSTLTCVMGAQSDYTAPLFPRNFRPACTDKGPVDIKTEHNPANWAFLCPFVLFLFFFDWCFLLGFHFCHVKYPEEAEESSSWMNDWIGRAVSILHIAVALTAGVDPFFPRNDEMIGVPFWLKRKNNGTLAAIHPLLSLRHRGVRTRGRETRSDSGIFRKRGRDGCCRVGVAAH